MTAHRIPLSELEQGIPFEQRHIGPDSEARAKMLAHVGYGSLDELTAAAVPDVIKNADALDLPGARTEAEVLAELRSLADRNQVLDSMVGLGYYGTFTPPVILRNVMENPAWYTAYTPYQPEISQGRLEALLNFQTTVADLTGLPTSGASLLDEGTAAAEAMALSLLLDMPWSMPPGAGGGNPLTRNYRTQEGRDLAFTCLQAGKYWPTLCDAIGRQDLKDDPRFADMASLIENAQPAIEALTEVFASGTVQEWREKLADWDGQWTVVQDTLEAAADPQTVANGYLQECETATGTKFKLVAVPMQFDEEPPPAHRAPEFNEHGDDILAELGLDWDAIVDLKVRGVTA